MKRLAKLDWKARKVNATFNLLTLHLNDHYDGWGFSLLRFDNRWGEHSLLKLCVFLPNHTTRKRLQWEGDFLFLRRYLTNTYHRIDDELLWNGKLSWSDKLKYKILKYIVG